MPHLPWHIKLVSHWCVDKSAVTFMGSKREGIQIDRCYDLRYQIKQLHQR